MARNSGSRRKFVWARQSGVLDAATFAEDLLFSFKDRAGGSVLLGATVVAIKGYVVPDVVGAEIAKGRVAIRVCDEADIEVDPLQTGHGPVDAGSENDWMAFMPFFIAQDEGEAGLQGASFGSWNHAGSPWGVDVRSNRKMEELNQTLGIWWANVGVGNPAATFINYDLSIGLKLA